jgi:hypothetical protein
MFTDHIFLIICFHSLRRLERLCRRNLSISLTKFSLHFLRNFCVQLQEWIMCHRRKLQAVWQWNICILLALRNEILTPVTIVISAFLPINGDSNMLHTKRTHVKGDSSRRI